MYFVTLKKLPSDPKTLNAIYDAAPADAAPKRRAPKVGSRKNGNAAAFNIVPVPRPKDVNDTDSLIDFYVNLFERGEKKFGKLTAPAISVPVIPAGTPSDPGLAEKSLCAVISAVEKFTEAHPESGLTLVLSIDTNDYPPEQRDFFEVFGYCESETSYEESILSLRKATASLNRTFRLKRAARPKTDTEPPSFRVCRDSTALRGLLTALEKPTEIPRFRVPAKPRPEFEPKGTFRDVLLEMKRDRNLTPVECYTRARIDRRLYSKIISDREYPPSKETACAFAVGMELNIEETQKLLDAAGFSLSKGKRYDLVIRYFIEKGIYDFNRINLALHSLGEKMFGVA